MAEKVKMVLFPDWGPRSLRHESTKPEGGRYELLAKAKAAEVVMAAIVVFKTFNKRGNEFETSEFTPPKYVGSFKVKYYRTTFKARAANTDPGWYLVEWGAHPGGDPETRVLRYKPLTRGLLIVGSQGRF